MATDLSELELESLDEETQAPPETRIKNAKAGRDVFHTLHQADKQRAFYRAKHQALLDGEPPYDQAKLAAAGMGTRTNCDWGDTAALASGVMSGLVDMNVSVEQLVRVPLRKEFVPDDEMRFNFENIVAEEVTRTIRDWEGYNCAYLTLGHYTFMHGVGIAYFEDQWDWRFEVSGLGDFVIPDGAKSSENEITVAACLRYMEIPKIYGNIRNEEMAARMGWNVSAVKKAILKAAPEKRDDWAHWQQELRNNSTGIGAGKSGKVGVIHLWVPEFDGTVSKYLVSKESIEDSGQDGEMEPWLYHRPNFYPEMRRGLIFFTYGIGNGTYHSISGMLRRLYPQALTLNRTQSNMVDAVNIGVGMIIQPLTEADATKMRIQNLGCMSVVPSAQHGTVIPRPMPNVADGAMPLVGDLRNTMSRRAGQFQGDSGMTGQNTEKTRFQVAAELEALGKVGATQMNLWYPSWDRLMREVTRRMCRENYSIKTPGGREVAEFRRRLESRGFPVELLQAIDFDAVRAERAIGAGSGAARTAALTQLREMAGDYDEAGRYNLTRDLTAAALNGNYDLATRYAPRMPENRTPVDTQFAELENMMVDLGKAPVLTPGQMPLVHLEVHVPKLIKMAQESEGNEEAMIAMAQAMLILHSHCIEHLETAQDSEPIQVQVAQYREVLQQVGEVVGNAVRKADKAQREAGEQQAAEGEQGGQDPMLVQKMAEANIKLQSIRTQANLKAQIEAERHEQKMMQDQQKFRQEMAHKDAATGADMLVNARKKLAETATHQAKAKDALEIARLKRASQSKPKSK